MTAAMRELNAMFTPGDSIPHSGIYRAMHYRHRFPHELTLLKGQCFPRCHRCGERIRFELVHSAEHIAHDADFRDSD